MIKKILIGIGILSIIFMTWVAIPLKDGYMFRIGFVAVLLVLLSFVFIEEMKQDSLLRYVPLCLIGMLLITIGISPFIPKGGESFWIDEMDTVYAISLTPNEILKNSIETGVVSPQWFEGGGTPPGYFMVTSYWANITGGANNLIFIHND